MNGGTVLFTMCEVCGEETPHRVLKGRIGDDSSEGFSGTVVCTACQHTHHATIPLEKPARIPLVISDGKRSERSRIEFGSMEDVTVDEELIWCGHNIKITAIDTKRGRVMEARASDIETIWAKMFDSLPVKVAIVKGANTVSETIDAAPDEEFAVGDLLELGREKVLIEKIKVKDRMVYGQERSVQARDIRRIYSKKVQHRQH